MIIEIREQAREDLQLGYRFYEEHLGSSDARPAMGTEIVIPPSDPSEPCLEPDTVELIRGIHQHAEAGHITWLQGRGKVYQLIEAPR